jgi:catechol 2,3-dioxygenase-like lactoylglutathione lyase family enzyme
VPIDHVKLPITDIDASRAFYTATLAPFGWTLVYDDGEPGLGFGTGDGADDNEPFDLLMGDAPAVRTHVAITATSTEQVDAFHAAALAAGGGNGAPGEGCMGSASIESGRGVVRALRSLGGRAPEGGCESVAVGVDEMDALVGERGGAGIARVKPK